MSRPNQNPLTPDSLAADGMQGAKAKALDPCVAKHNPATRGQAIAAYCRECIHDPGAAGTWREQVAVCGCSGCPLWAFRPLPRTPPSWLASRVPDNLPDGFGSLYHDEAIAILRGNIDARADSAVVRAHLGRCEGAPATTLPGRGKWGEVTPVCNIGK